MKDACPRAIVVNHPRIKSRVIDIMPFNSHFLVGKITDKTGSPSLIKMHEKIHMVLKLLLAQKLRECFLPSVLHFVQDEENFGRSDIPSKSPARKACQSCFLAMMIGLAGCCYPTFFNMSKVPIGKEEWISRFQGMLMSQKFSSPGKYKTGWRNVTLLRKDKTSFSATLFYPASTHGLNARYDPQGTPYPAISFGHGFLQKSSKYQSTLSHLAGWGYFVIATHSALELFPSHAQYACDLKYTLDYLEEQNQNTQSFLCRQIDTHKIGFLGHSMGAGAILLASSTDPRVRIVVTLAAAETNPSAIASCSGIKVPVVYIAGSEDKIVPFSDIEKMWNHSIPDSRLIKIAGGFHCGFEDSWFPGCDCGGISREAQLSLTRFLMTIFFNFYLYDDPQSHACIKMLPKEERLFELQ